MGVPEFTLDSGACVAVMPAGTGMGIPHAACAGQPGMLAGMRCGGATATACEAAHNARPWCRHGSGDGDGARRSGGVGGGDGGGGVWRRRLFARRTPAH